MPAHDYKLETKDVGDAVRHIKEAFDKKRLLEKDIVRLIRHYEEETGLAIDSIKYQRDITIPVRSARYTDLTIIISPENL